MTIEYQQNLPSDEKILNEIKKYDLGDKFGSKVIELDKQAATLEEKGEISGWRKRLLLYELNRRWQWFKQIDSRTGKGASYIDGALAITELTPAFFDRLRRPAKVASWEQTIGFVRRKSVRMAKGSFRSVPTPAQIDFLNGFYRSRQLADYNILFYEPKENIESYKPQGLIVFPDKLRQEMLRHILVVDLVAQVPSFGSHDIHLFWHAKGQQLRESASTIEQLDDNLSPDAQMRHEDSTDISLSGSTALPPKYSLHGWRDYEVWNTGDWDKISKGHEKFIELANQFLVVE